MTTEKGRARRLPREKRRAPRPPEAGWALGADGLPKVSWVVLAALLVALGVILLAAGYLGYGAMILILACAAAVNLI